MNILFQDIFRIKSIKEDPEWTESPCVEDIEMHTSKKGYDCYLEMKTDDYPVEIGQHLEMILVRASCKSIHYWVQYDREPPYEDCQLFKDENIEQEKENLDQFRRLVDKFEYVCHGMVYTDEEEQVDINPNYYEEEEKNPTVHVAFGKMLMVLKDAKKEGRLKNMVQENEWIYCMLRKRKI